MFDNSQIIIVLLIILIFLQLYQLCTNDNIIEKENFNASDHYKAVNYNTPMMKCDGNTGMLKSKCTVKSNVPTIKKICDSTFTPENLTSKPVQEKVDKIQNKVDNDDPAVDDNSLLQLLNESEFEQLNDVQSVGNLEN